MLRSSRKNKTVQLNPDITLDIHDRQLVRRLVKIDADGSRDRNSRSSVRAEQGLLHSVHSLTDRQFREVFPDIASLSSRVIDTAL